MTRPSLPDRTLKTTRPFRTISGRSMNQAVFLNTRLTAFTLERIGRLSRVSPRAGCGAASMVFRRAAPAAFFQRLQQNLRLAIEPRVTLLYQPVRAVHSWAPAVEGTSRRLTGTTSLPVVYRSIRSQADLQRPSSAARSPAALSPLALQLPALPKPALRPAAAPAWDSLRAGANSFPEATPLEIIHRAQSTQRISLFLSPDTIERWVSRGIRVVTVRSGSAPVLSPKPGSQQLPGATLSTTTLLNTIPLASPVPQVVLNRQPVIQNGPGYSEEPLPPSRAKHSPFEPRAAWEGQLNPPPDLNHLADQVVQLIDQRMIAYRERMGRV